jgi:hypothetical protein
MLLARKFRWAPALVLALGAGPLAGSDFRIETKVFVEGTEEPVSENLTLLHAGVVYDFLAQPEQVAVFRRSLADGDGRFILLDPIRQVRSEIDTAEIVAFLDELKAWAGQQQDPLLKFAADPQFKEHFDPIRGELRLESDVMRYLLMTEEPKDPQGAADYREFSDWYGRLAAVMYVGSTPPFPRLVVNASLARHGRLPRTVELVIPAKRPFRTKDRVIRAEHRIAWRLARQDEEKINQVAEQLVRFKPVEKSQFLLR